jgi:hypothetical protein
VSKRRSQSPRQRKQGRESSSPTQAVSASIAPVADTSLQAITSEAPPPPASELDELDAGWDELLV